MTSLIDGASVSVGHMMCCRKQNNENRERKRKKETKLQRLCTDCAHNKLLQKKGEQRQNVAKLKHFKDRTTSLKSKTIPRSSTHKVINIS